MLKAGVPWPMLKRRATVSGSLPSSGVRLVPGIVSPVAMSPEQAATARLEAEREALASERARIEQAASFLETCARCLTDARDAVLVDVQQELVDLVLKVAMQVIHDEVAQRPEVITLQVEKALARVKEDSMMTVRVHPSMLDILRQAGPGIVEALGPTARVHFEADSSIAPGGCMVETSQQIVDARIATQLDRIGTVLKQDPSQ